MHRLNMHMLYSVRSVTIGNTLEYVTLLLSAPVINPDIANYAG